MKYFLFIACAGILPSFGQNTTNAQSNEGQNPSNSIEFATQSAKTALANNNQAAALKWALEALRLAPGSKDSLVKISAQGIMGEVLERYGAYEQAAEHRQTQLKRLLKWKKDDLYTVYVLHELGLLHLKIEQPDSALSHFLHALSLLQGHDSLRLKANSHNNIGFTYLQMDQWKNAGSHLNRAFSMVSLASQEDSILLSSICDNLAKWHLNVNQPDSQVFYREKAYNLVPKIPDLMQKYARYATKWANCIAERQPEQALQVLQDIRLEKLIGSTNDKRLQVVLASLKGEMNIRRKLGQQDEYMALASEAVAVFDSLLQEQEERYNAAARAIADYEMGMTEKAVLISDLKVKEHEAALALEQKSNLLTITLFVVAIALVLVAGLIVYNYYKRRTRQLLEQEKLRELALQNQELQQQQLQEELRDKSHDLRQIALDNTQRLEWLQHLRSQLREAEKLPAEKQGKAIKQLNLKIGSQLMAHERQGKLRDKIDVVNRAFYQKLVDKHNGLTKNDVELSSLLLMGLDVKEIAHLRGIEARSVSRAKNRLRHKLALPPNSDVKAYLESL